MLFITQAYIGLYVKSMLESDSQVRASSDAEVARRASTADLSLEAENHYISRF